MRYIFAAVALFMLGLAGLGVWYLGARSVADELNTEVVEAQHGDRNVGVADPTYTCPMHLMIEEESPGDCPICGMPLAEKATAPAQGNVGESLVGHALGSDAADAPVKKQRKILRWVAPMDPTYISDKPGKSPMGMDLVPVYADEGGGTTVAIDPVVVQNMGVRIARANRGQIHRHIRAIGTVDVAEDSLSVVNLRYSGWIEKLYVDETGVFVGKGKRLFSIYSPELVSAQDEYLLAVRSGGPDSQLARSARARLELWDIPPAEMDRIEKEEKSLRTFTVVAPRSGYVLHKNVVQGARVRAGADLYRIGNLSKIWVNAEIYEFDAPWIRVGLPATMELSFQKGKNHEGRVSTVYPTLNPKTRTLTVRLEFANPGLSLKPGSFATVQIDAQHKEDVLAIPTEAILHSGTRQIVFVAVDLGRYEAREISTGLVGDRHLTEVLSGVEEGERVVTSGQFLLDSESQLQEAVQKLLAERLHAKEKRHSRGEGAHAGHDHSGDAPAIATYWTCGMHPQVVQDRPGTCPICGMDLTEKKR